MWLSGTSTTVEINNFVGGIVIDKVWNIPRNAFRWYLLSLCGRSSKEWLHCSALHNHLCNQHTSQNFNVGIRYLQQCGDKHFVEGTVIYKTSIIPPNVYRQTKRDSLKNRKFLLCICVCSSFGYLAAKDMQVINRLTLIGCVFPCCYSFQSTAVPYSDILYIYIYIYIYI